MRRTSTSRSRSTSRKGRNVQQGEGPRRHGRPLRAVPRRAGSPADRADLADALPVPVLRGRDGRGRGRVRDRHRPVGHPGEGPRRAGLPATGRTVARLRDLLLRCRHAHGPRLRGAGPPARRRGLGHHPLRAGHALRFPRPARRERLRAPRVPARGRHLAGRGPRGRRAARAHRRGLPPPPERGRDRGLLPAGARRTTST